MKHLCILGRPFHVLPFWRSFCLTCRGQQPTTYADYYTQGGVTVGGRCPVCFPPSELCPKCPLPDWACACTPTADNETGPTTAQTAGKDPSNKAEEGKQ